MARDELLGNDPQYAQYQAIQVELGADAGFVQPTRKPGRFDWAINMLAQLGRSLAPGTRHMSDHQLDEVDQIDQELLQK